MIHHKKSKTVFEEDVFQYLFPTAGSQQFLTQVQLRLRLFWQQHRLHHVHHCKAEVKINHQTKFQHDQ